MGIQNNNLCKLQGECVLTICSEKVLLYTDCSLEATYFNKSKFFLTI